MVLGVYVSMCAVLPMAYREQLGEERKELVVPPEYETSPPPPLAPDSLSTGAPHARAWPGRKGSAGSGLGDMLVPTLPQPLC